MDLTFLLNCRLTRLLQESEINFRYCLRVCLYLCKYYQDRVSSRHKGFDKTKTLYSPQGVV